MPAFVEFPGDNQTDEVGILSSRILPSILNLPNEVRLQMGNLYQV